MKSGPATHKPNKKQKPNGKLYWKRWFDCFFMHDFRTFLLLALLFHGNFL